MKCSTPYLTTLAPLAYRRTENGQKLEPLEEVVCEVEEEFGGAIIEALTLRKGEVTARSPVPVINQRNDIEHPNHNCLIQQALQQSR